MQMNYCHWIKFQLEEIKELNYVQPSFLYDFLGFIVDYQEVIEYFGILFMVTYRLFVF